MGLNKQFDAFLSHNSSDKPAVENIAWWLTNKAKLKVWFDKWNLVPGEPWQEALEAALDQSKCCVIFFGENIGSWQLEELRVALDERVSKKLLRVVPVLLPGARKEEKEGELPHFLRRLTWVRFRHEVNEEDALHSLVCGIKGIAPGRSAAIMTGPEVCPFRGLEVFRKEDAPFFFGREAIVQRLTEHVNNYQFLAVAGPSGSGKSSIVQAGLIPTLELSHPDVTIFSPRHQPLTELAIALYQLSRKEKPSSAILERLGKSDEELYFIAREIALGQQKKGRMLLVVDQFEELFTLTTNEEERKQFIALLLKVKDRPESNLSLVITMRSDFIGKCAVYPDLNTFVIDYFFQVGPMSSDELQLAIMEPARVAHLSFEAGLVDQILNDVKGASGELPLLEFALLELYKRREGNSLTHQAYKAIGGVEGALVKRADEEFNKLTDIQKEILCRMFVLRLVRPGEGTEDTRRRATREELLHVGSNDALAEELINRWSGPEVRMLTTYRDNDRQQEFIDVAHEALIRRWDKVQEWLAESREESLLIGRLRQAAQEWQEHQQDPDYLYHGAPLLQVRELLPKYGQDLTPLEDAFVKACITQQENKHKAEEERKIKELESAKKLAEARQRQLEDAKKLAEVQNHELAVAQKLATTQQQKNKLFLYIIGIVILASIGLGFLAYFLNENKKDAQKQLAKYFWSNSKIALDKHKPLEHLHLISKAISASEDNLFTEDLLLDAQSSLPIYKLGKSFIAKDSETGFFGITVSKDERHILLNDREKGIWLLQASTGRVLAVMKHQGYVWGSGFSQDESRILSWGADGVRLWQAPTGRPLAVMQHERRAGGTVFSKDRSRILTWGNEGTIRLWQASTGRLLRVMKFDGEIRGAAFSRNGRTMVAWGEGGLRLWQAANAQVPVDLKQEGYVHGAIFSQDGRHILNWGGRKIHLWKLPSRQLLAVMKHELIVSKAGFSQDGSRILSWGGREVRLWHATTGQFLAGSKHEGLVHGAIFDKDERRILSWGEDGLRLWYTPTKQSIRPVTAAPPGKHSNPDQPLTFILKQGGEVYGAVFSKDESRILSWGKEEVLLWQIPKVNPHFLNQWMPNMYSSQLWKTMGGRLLTVMKHEERGEEDIFNRGGAVFSKNERSILSWSKNGVRLWQTPTGRLLAALNHERNIHGAVFNRDERHLFTWGQDGIRIWQQAHSQSSADLTHQGNIQGATFSKDESRILSWAKNGTITLWQAAQPSFMSVMHHNGNVIGAIFSKDERRILSWNEEGTIRVWQTLNGHSLAVLKHDGFVRGAVFSKNEERILSWGEDGVRLWQLPDRRLLNIMKHQGDIEGAIFSSDERRIMSWGEDEIRLWQVPGGRLLKVMKHQGDVNKAVFSQDDRHILSWGFDETIRLWEASTGRQIAVMQHAGMLEGAALSKDERCIISWGLHGTIRLWQASTGKSLGGMKHTGNLNGVAFNKDARHILSWGREGIRLWQTATGQLLVGMKHEGPVQGAVFSQDERRLLSWGEDGIRLWQIPGGQPLAVLKPEGFIRGAAFSKDERRILSWGEAGIRLWDIRVDLDFPKDVFSLQIQAITGTAINLNSLAVYCLPNQEWEKINEEYFRLAREHYKKCKYPKTNLWGRFYPEEAKKVNSSKASLAPF